MDPSLLGFLSCLATLIPRDTRDNQKLEHYKKQTACGDKWSVHCSNCTWKKHILLCKMSPASHFSFFVRRQKNKIKNIFFHSCCKETLRANFQSCLSQKKYSESWTVIPHQIFLRLLHTLHTSHLLHLMYATSHLSHAIFVTLHLSHTTTAKYCPRQNTVHELPSKTTTNIH
jgi:hypothetical protein